MRFIGRRERVAAALLEQMDWAEAETAANDTITLYVAFNYGGRAEILDAAARYDGGGEDAFRALLYAPEMHDPDLIIRTSGEQRMSNYLLWQSRVRGARVPRRAVAGLHARRVRGRARRVRRAPAPVRGPLMAAGRGGRDAGGEVRRRSRRGRRAATRATSGRGSSSRSRRSRSPA